MDPLSFFMGMAFAALIFTTIHGLWLSRALCFLGIHRWWKANDNEFYCLECGKQRPR